ncbi:MAG: helix-turn-helix transcriptional regulator [Clostridia bacterium]|nr:helix-turn-helix transcriptional regulator [Clostridia bacterium]MBR3144682.1 helix-turn-helix transcriptional regulator [Clostridia bacterium]
MINSNENISKRLAQFRTLAGYTQKTAAEAIGMTKNSYARMERAGNPKLDLLKQLADLFHVTTNDILYGKTPFGNLQNNDTPKAFKDVGPEKTTIDTRPDNIILTANEKNIIKLCRALNKDQRKEVVDFIYKHIEESGLDGDDILGKKDNY